MMDQVPGFYRRRVGDLTVTALNDGFLDLPFAAMPAITAEEAAASLANAFRPPVARSTVSAFLVQGGGRTILIDTGAGALFGPTMGRLPANLAAAGVAPADIDMVLLTHMHGDHLGGLTHGGTAAFPNAAVMAAEAERAFWLDVDPASVPDAMRNSVVTAQASLAPYKDRLSTFGTAPVAPGITPVPLPGHTPGHSGFRIGEGSEALLIWADVIHLQDIQASGPEIGLMFDTDPEGAIATRRRVLDMAASERMLVAGMHLHFPTFHHVARAGQGYALVPEMWSPVV